MEENVKPVFDNYTATRKWANKINNEHNQWLKEIAICAREVHDKGERGLKTFDQFVVWLEELTEK